MKYEIEIFGKTDLREKTMKILEEKLQKK